MSPNITILARWTFSMPRFLGGDSCIGEKGVEKKSSFILGYAGCIKASTITAP